MSSSHYPIVVQPRSTAMPDSAVVWTVVSPGKLFFQSLSINIMRDNYLFAPLFVATHCCNVCKISAERTRTSALGLFCCLSPVIQLHSLTNNYMPTLIKFVHKTYFLFRTAISLELTDEPIQYKAQDEDKSRPSPEEICQLNGN